MCPPNLAVSPDHIKIEISSRCSPLAGRLPDHSASSSKGIHSQNSSLTELFQALELRHGNQTRHMQFVLHLLDFINCTLPEGAYIVHGHCISSLT
jgi:hypothetical protein